VSLTVQTNVDDQARFGLEIKLTKELALFVRQARQRLSGVPLDEKDRLSDEQAKHIEDFKLYLARKVALALRLELFLPATWSWHQTGPGARFAVDARNFLLVQHNLDCQLFLETNERQVLLTILRDADAQFEDRLVVTIGDVVENVGHTKGD